MLKHHHHNGSPVSTSRRRRSHLHHTSSRSVPEVGIIPGNRFLLLPLKKVTALVRPHTPCRQPSATKTKPCIVSKAKQACSQGVEIHRERLLQEFYVRSQAHSNSSRLIAKQRRRRSVLVAKTRLSPVCEQASGVAEQELLLESERLLWNDGRLVDSRNCRTLGVSYRSRAQDTSIFALGERTLLESFRGACLAASSTQVLQELNLNMATKKKKKRSNSFSNASDIDLVLYRTSRRTHTKSRFSVSTSTERECLVPGGRSFGRNNRVSPSSLSHGQQLHPEFVTGNDCATSFRKADDLETPRNMNRGSSRATSFGKADELVTPRNMNRGSSRATSFDKADELVTPKNRGSSRATSFGKVDELVMPRNKKRGSSRATSFGKADELVTPRNQNRGSSRATSFGKADEIVTPRNKNRGSSRATSFDKADELVTPRNKSRSKSRSNFTTTSTKADELVPELETPWNKDGSNDSKDNCTTSFSKADELVTGCDKNSLRNFRSNSTTSIDKGDEIVKLCDKNRRKSRGHRRTSSGKADEILIREKKRRNFSFLGCSHQIRSCGPFLCSFTNKNDLPVGPSPLQLSRRLQNKASVAQGEV